VKFGLEGHHRAVAAGQMQRVGKVEPAAMQIHRIVDGLPTFQRDMPLTK